MASEDIQRERWGGGGGGHFSWHFLSFSLSVDVQCMVVT